MFDFHLHSSVSFDSECQAIDILKKAEKAGLREICFTDHYDYNSERDKEHFLFLIDNYKNTYDNLTSSSVTVRRGVEYGLTEWNKCELEELLNSYKFDFVIGSVHYVNGFDPYYPDYWNGKTLKEAFELYLTETLRCVKIHDNFDVLGHLTYVCKSVHNPSHKTVEFNDFLDITDEIMKTLIKKGRGMEVNTSGVDRIGDFLPSFDYIKRFKELGGEIITVGTDAHDDTRVGQYINEVLENLKSIFGYVCTFESRKPIFHKL